jgi:hypothetical protein
MTGQPFSNSIGTLAARAWSTSVSVNQIGGSP